MIDRSQSLWGVVYRLLPGFVLHHNNRRPGISCFQPKPPKVIKNVCMIGYGYSVGVMLILFIGRGSNEICVRNVYPPWTGRIQGKFHC